MTTRCKDKCLKFKDMVSQSTRAVYRIEGLVRCHTCEINIPKEAAIENENRCPCCNFLIRTKPRNGDLKDMIIETVARI